jgi:hypothetical protein
MSDKTGIKPDITRRPPWWQWFEPPQWFPKWLHVLACTHCRGLRA